MDILDDNTHSSVDEFRKRVLYDLLSDKPVIQITLEEFGLILSNRVTDVVEVIYKPFSIYPRSFRVSFQNKLYKTVLVRDYLSIIHKSTSITTTIGEEYTENSIWEVVKIYAMEGYNASVNKYVR